MAAGVVLNVKVFHLGQETANEVVHSILVGDDDRLDEGAKPFHDPKLLVRLLQSRLLLNPGIAGMLSTSKERRKVSNDPTTIPKLNLMGPIKPSKRDDPQENSLVMDDHAAVNDVVVERREEVWV